MKRTSRKIKGVVIKQMILPTFISLKASELPNGKWKMRYVEKFNRIPEGVMESTKNILADFGVKAQVRGNTLSYTRVTTFDDVASAIVGEFIARSNLGRMTLAELMMLSLAGAANIRQKRLEMKEKEEK